MDLKGRFDRFATTRFDCALGDKQSIDIDISKTTIFNRRGGSVLQTVVIVHAAIFDEQIDLLAARAAKFVDTEIWGIGCRAVSA